MSNIDVDWKKIPCHFVWDLGQGPKKVHQTSSLFQQETAELYPDDEDACYKYVYLAYLAFFNSQNLEEQPVDLLDKADEIIDKIKDDSGKRAFQMVSLGNRAWILSMSGESEDKIAPVVSTLLSKYKEHCLSENKMKETAYLNAIEALALRRLMRNEKAEEKLRSAITVISDIAMWHYELGRVVGSNLKTAIEKTEAKIPHFEKALDLRPDYVQCMVKIIDAFNRVGNLEASEEMIEGLEKHDISNNPKALCVKASFYIRSRKYDRALEILHEAERFHRSDVYNLLASTYRLKAYSLSPLKRPEVLRTSLTYVEKCLHKHPGSYEGITNKFEILCGLKVSAEEVESFLRNLNEERALPPSYRFSAFDKMLRIYEKMNESNLHPDLKILLSLYENMATTVIVTLGECKESERDNQKSLPKNYRETIKNVQAFVDKYLKKKWGREEMYERFRETNERLHSYVSNAA